MATNKRTVIGADEELLVKGQLTVTGNVTQIETTQTVNRLESDELVVNADSDAVTAKVILNGASSNATLAFNSTSGNLEISRPIAVSGGSISGTFVGDLTGDVTGTVSDISNHNTNALAEGSSNLYYTSARANTDFDTRLATKDTGDLTEGSNLYFTTARARSSISHVNAGGDGDISYNGVTGVITYNGPTAADVRLHFSATDNGGDGSFSYSNGVFTYTGPSASETRAHFSANNGVDYNSSTGAFQAVESEIQHDSLSGFVADEHVAHSSITLTAGSGLTGGGTIAASRTFNVGAGTGINVAADSISTNDSQIVHDNLSGFVADEHIAHSGVTLTAGDGLSGGGTIAASRSFAVDGTVVRTSGAQTIAGSKTFTGTLDLTGATVTVNTEASTDSDNSVASTSYVNTRINQVVGTAPEALDTLGEIAAAMGNSNNLGGVVTNNTSRISNLENRNLTAGDGLSGGGNLTADRSFAVDGTVARTTTNMIAGSGLTGGGTLASNRTFNVGAGTGITVNADDVAVNMSAFDTGDLAEGSNLYYTDARADARVNLQTGSNLDLSSKDTDDLSEGTSNLYYTNARVESYLSGGDGIDFASGTIDVDGTVVRTSGNQSIAGTKTFTGALIAPSTGTATAGAIYYDNSLGEAYIYVNGQQRKITPAVDAGDVEDVGTGEVNIYAGTRQDGLTSYAGIKSMSSGTYTTLSESANVITVEGDISAIRGAFSASGSTLSYNSGVFTSTADNYNKWKFTTPTTGEVDVDSEDLVTFTAGSGIGISHSGRTITFTNTNSADITSVGAGNGLTGGGSSGGVTLNVVGGDGINANANDIEVDNTVVRTTGTQTITGDKTLSGSTQIDSLNINGEYTFPTADGSGSQVLTTNGSGTLSFQSLSAVGLTNVFAGDGMTRSTGVGTVTLNTVGGYGITVNADNIQVANADIRGLFSSGGDISYNSTTGAISFTERTDAEVRGLLSGTGLISYNSTSGQISTTADNYGSWSFMEGNGSETGSIGTGETLHFEQGTGIQVEKTGDRQLTISATATGIRGMFSGSSGVNFDSGTGAITADQGEIRGFFSAGGDLSYNSSSGQFSVTKFTTSDARSAISAGGDLAYNSGTGVMSFTERSDSQIRGLFSASGDISYNASTGVFSFTDSDTIGTVTSVSVGTGLDVVNASTTPTISLDLSEFTDMTQAVVGTQDELILLDNGAERRKLISEITLSDFNNDSGWTSNVGDITAVTAGSYLTGGGSSGGVTLNVDATSANTASKVVARDSSGNFAAGVITATATAARYADLAEIYATDQNYQPGTVVVFGGEKEVTVTDHQNSPRVAGVISTDPAYMMNKDAEGQYVALRGRVPCKVIGPVKKGDVLITSDRPGFACVSSDPAFVGAACIVGKAIGEWDTPSEGVVEIMV